MDSNYSTLITPPNFSQINVGQNLYDIGEYQKIMNGENSRRMPDITHPIGRVYVTETGVLCNDIKTGLSVPRQTIINAKIVSSKNGVLDSAYSDFNNAGLSNIFDDTNRKFLDKCMSVDVNEIDKTGKQTVVKTKYLSLAEIERSPSSLFSGVVPTIPKEFKEPFSMHNVVEDRVTVGNFMKHMDGGQRFFVGTLAVMGLYMYHQLLYGVAP